MAGKRGDGKAWDDWHARPPISVRLKNDDLDWLDAHKAELGGGYSKIISRAFSEFRERYEMQMQSADDANASADDANASADDANAEDAE